MGSGRLSANRVLGVLFGILPNVDAGVMTMALREERSSGTNSSVR